MTQKFKNYKSLIGIQPLNEPWELIPFEIIREFYWRSYHIITRLAPHLIVMFHDSFRLSRQYWGNNSKFLLYCNNYMVDSHLYLAWSDERSSKFYQEVACNSAKKIKEMEEYGVPVVVGEWSLATDNCAMWLNGFNDNCKNFYFLCHFLH